jgi:hypothetical protein
VDAGLNKKPKALQWCRYMGAWQHKLGIDHHRCQMENIMQQHHENIKNCLSGPSLSGALAANTIEDNIYNVII